MIKDLPDNTLNMFIGAILTKQKEKYEILEL